MRIEINVTHKCNARCIDCNRAIGLAKFDEMDITPDQIRQYGETVDGDVERVAIAGGEPTLLPNLEEIIRAAAESFRPRKGWVMTNGLRERPTVRMPRGWRWKVTPLDNPNDITSGKSIHRPFFVSPADYGIKSSYQACKIKSRCGFGLEARGFTMCGVAGTLGRILGIDPYLPTLVDSEKPKGICRHCPYGLPKKQQHGFLSRFKLGDKSPTFTEAFARATRKTKFVSG